MGATKMTSKGRLKEPMMRYPNSSLRQFSVVKKEIKMRICAVSLFSSSFFFFFPPPHPLLPPTHTLFWGDGIGVG